MILLVLGKQVDSATKILLPPSLAAITSLSSACVLAEGQQLAISSASPLPPFCILHDEKKARSCTMQPNHWHPPFKSRTDWSGTAIRFPSGSLFGLHPSLSACSSSFSLKDRGKDTGMFLKPYQKSAYWGWAQCWQYDLRSSVCTIESVCLMDRDFLWFGKKRLLGLWDRISGDFEHSFHDGKII